MVIVYNTCTKNKIIASVKLNLYTNNIYSHKLIKQKLTRQKTRNISYVKLSLVAAFVGFLSAILAFIIKHITEYCEERLIHFIYNQNIFYLVGLPSIGITTIYFLRKYLFKGRKNKGITEIYKTLDHRKDHLPWYKIPSHFINGFLTVIFGGSTGVEVSTVVFTATVGNIAYEGHYSANLYKRELVCAGVVAGIAILFNSPLAGVLFALEVIARKVNKPLLISCLTSGFVAFLFIHFFDNNRILSLPATQWHTHALPWFLLLGILGGVLSTYFTTLVIQIKKFFGNINNNFIRVNLGACAVGSMLIFFPFIYGDSYEGLNNILNGNVEQTWYILLALIFLKPLAASLTLGAGGDGGVFAPSIVSGAVLGVLIAYLGNYFFQLNLIPLNFALVGAAATLSASIAAPLTTVFLICNIVPDGFILILPILIGSIVGKYFAQLILPYTVYTYDFYVKKSICK